MNRIVPKYISNLPEEQIIKRKFRSNKDKLLEMPNTKLINFDDRVFQIVALSLLNESPISLC